MLRLKRILEKEVSWEDVFLGSVLAYQRKKKEFPKLLFYYPPAKTNPFQDALYSRANHASHVALPLLDLQRLEHIDWPYGITLHIHWLGGVLKEAKSEEHADSLIGEFLSLLNRLKRKGIKLIWTVHNVLPHQMVFSVSEKKLRNEVAKIVDLIHILTRETLGAVKDFYSLDSEKVFFVVHPGYDLHYMNNLGQDIARSELSWDSSAFYFLFFGGIERYKNIEGLLCTFKQIREKNKKKDPRLIIAGPPINTQYAQELAELIGPEDARTITYSPKVVPESEVHLFFSACNVVVMPYGDVLNSGVSLLAANFARPIVAPRKGAIVDSWGEGYELLYEPGHDAGLLKAMERSLVTPVKKELFRRIRSLHDPAKVSAEFFTHIGTLYK